MKNKKLKKSLEVYGLIGKALCACAGGIVGFILGGPFVAFAGIFVGTITGHMLEKMVVRVPA
jgi:hypothetical protein